MKTTIELPDALFRKAKATAAERGVTLKAFLTDALTEKLNATAHRGPPSEPPWMEGFGKLSRLHGESKRILRTIDEEFEVIEDEDAQ